MYFFRFLFLVISFMIAINGAEAATKKHNKHGHNIVTKNSQAKNSQTKNAQIGKKAVRALVSDVPMRVQTALVADADTGLVLYSQNSNHKIYPASLTKMMTLYVMFDELKHKRISLQTAFPVSKRSQSMRPMKLGLKAGQKITAGDAIMGMIVKSANDAAVAAAEGIGGTEQDFAHKMNLKAKKLGMNGTHFVNASGWHDKRQVTTATDMAKLGLALKRDFPEYYPLFKKTSFVFRGEVIKGHNHVTKDYIYAEGLKTGFTGPAGYNLVTTASYNGKSLIGVVTGSPTWRVRDTKMVSLLDKYFGVEQGVKYTALDNKKRSEYKASKLSGNKQNIKKPYKKHKSKSHHVAQNDKNKKRA